MISVSGKYVSRRFDLGGYDAFYTALPDAKLDGYFLLNAYAAYTLSKQLRFLLMHKISPIKNFLTCAVITVFHLYLLRVPL